VCTKWKMLFGEANAVTQCYALQWEHGTKN
jgi:hypothetical protein